MASTPSSSAPEATTTSRAPPPKLTCLCSPTNHPGSFRCSRHRDNPSGEGGHGQSRGGRASGKGRSVRALLLRKIASPSDRDRQRRRCSEDFQPRPSRLRLMNK